MINFLVFKCLKDLHHATSLPGECELIDQFMVRLTMTYANHNCFCNVRYDYFTTMTACWDGCNLI